MEFNIKEILGFFPPVENLNVEKGKKGKKGGKRRKQAAASKHKSNSWLLSLSCSTCQKRCTLFPPPKLGKVSCWWKRLLQSL